MPILLDLGQFPDQFEHVQATDLSRPGEAILSWKKSTASLRRLSKLVPPSRYPCCPARVMIELLGPELYLPLPGVTGSAAVLRYLHFTVVMNPARRLAHYVAYNIDGSQFVKLKRDLDKWSSDPLLPESLQMNLPLLMQSPFDRGHLMARSTGCWGELRSAQISARQAFYWPNVAPQHQKLNRYWWLALEIWERQTATARGRLTGFSGPVFSIG